MTREFVLGEDVPLNIEEAVDWYNQKEPGVGGEFAKAVYALLRNIEKHDEYITRPLLRLPTGNVHQILMGRFPYRAVVLETKTKRLVLRVLHNRRDDTHWRSRLP